MEKAKQIKEELVRKIQQCMNEVGFKAVIELSEHEGIVHGRMEVEMETLKVVTHITDREMKPLDCGPVANEVARAHLRTAIIRPTLTVQTATGTVSKQRPTVPEAQIEQPYSQTERKEVR